MPHIQLLHHKCAMRGWTWEYTGLIGFVTFTHAHISISQKPPSRLSKYETRMTAHLLGFLIASTSPTTLAVDALTVSWQAWTQLLVVEALQFVGSDLVMTDQQFLKGRPIQTVGGTARVECVCVWIFLCCASFNLPSVEYVQLSKLM